MTAEHRLAARGALNRKAAIASVGVALILGTLKIYAVLRTGSIAMLGSLADTGLDLIASIVTLVAVQIAARPADEDHRFGHGKAEALAALFQVSLISVAAVGIVVRSIERFGSGGTPVDIEYGVGVSLIAILLTIALVGYQAHIIRSTGSIAIASDSLHYRSDLALNSSVILALVLESLLQVRGADALFGVAIGLWLAWNAMRTATRAIDQLMDKEWPDDRRARFLAIATDHPEVRDVHDLRTRTSGSRDFAQFHVRVDPAMTIAHGHRLMDALEDRLHRDFPDVEMLIHLDPVESVNEMEPPTRTKEPPEP